MKKRMAPEILAGMTAAGRDPNFMRESLKTMPVWLMWQVHAKWADWGDTPGCIY
jgi:hypothetical protein